MFGRERPWPELSLEEIVKRARLLVIDDQEFPYLKLFRNAGYQVQKWNDITKLQELERGDFDLILLDLQGIGRALSNDEGLGILRHIKEVSPHQVVIAYSNANWPVRYQPFFDLADEVLSKTADYVDFKRVVDRLLQEHFSVGFHVECLQHELESAGLTGKRSNRVVERSIRERNPEILRRHLDQNMLDSVTTERIIGLAQVAIGIAQIWT